jgi:hypothetical protein
LYSFAAARPSDDVQDAGLREGICFTFFMSSSSRIEWTPEKQLQILPLRVRMTANESQRTRCGHLPARERDEVLSE